MKLLKDTECRFCDPEYTRRNLGRLEDGNLEIGLVPDPDAREHLRMPVLFVGKYKKMYMHDPPGRHYKNVLSDQAFFSINYCPMCGRRLKKE